MSIYKLGLGPIDVENYKEGGLSFISNIEEAVNYAPIQFITEDKTIAL